MAVHKHSLQIANCINQPLSVLPFTRNSVIVVKTFRLFIFIAEELIVRSRALFAVTILVLLVLIPFTRVLGQGAGEYQGFINDAHPYQFIDLPDVPDGANIIVEVEAISGNLDPVVILFFENDIWAAENDDRSPGDPNSYLKYERAPGGNYYLVISRYGVENGETSGDFAATVIISTATAIPLSSVNENTVPDPDASGYPTLDPQPIADWTVLTYLGADNNLEAGLIYDLDELERGGGSDGTVRVLALIDRAEGYDASNGDWTDTRLYEITPDISNDAAVRYPPTIDSRMLATLGERNSADPLTLLEFLVWGMTTYPAQHYAVVINNHGGAWAGTVTDETSGPGEILTLPEIQSAFDRALALTGVPRFDLLINDSCLMSSIEFFTMIQDSVSTVFSSPEIMNNPGFDMTLLVSSLRSDPNILLADLGERMAHKYMQDMRLGFPGIEPFMGVAVTDLSRFGPLVDAINDFSALVERKPDAYAPFLGRIRSNTYTYSTWADVTDQIDLGNFMKRIISATTDDLMQTAASNVLQAIDNTIVYSTAGETLAPETSFLNIFFPVSTSSFNPRYLQQTTLTGWTAMLRSYFSSLLDMPYGRDAFSGAPKVNITNVYPETASIYAPVTVGMEVEGNNVSYGDFTVDQIQPDGTAVRLRQARILTEVVNNDNSVEYLNIWNPGVDDSRFTWYVRLPQVTNGTSANFENISQNNSLSSLAGRYRYPGSDWMDVSILFNDDGSFSSMISRQENSRSFASILPEAGGEFQAWRAVVTPDGTLNNQPGNLYQWTAQGLSWENAPAPTGDYNLGFLVQGFTGETGFNSVPISVNNNGLDRRLRGFLDLDWGFNLIYPSDYYDLIWFPSNGWEEASSADGSELIYVYPVFDALDDLQAIGTEGLGQFGVSVNASSFAPLTVDGLNALEFTYSFQNDDGLFNGRAFAVYRPELNLGLVFAFEALDGHNLDKMFELLRDNLRFFDVTQVNAADTGIWSRDYGPTALWPISSDLLANAQDKDGWRMYRDSGSPAFIAISESAGVQASTVLGSLLLEYVPNSDFEQLARDVYYGEVNTWQTAFYRRTQNGAPLIGGMFVTVSNGVAHTIWFELPEAEAEARLQSVYVTVDGYTIDAP